MLSPTNSSQLTAIGITSDNPAMDRPVGETIKTTPSIKIHLFRRVSAMGVPTHLNRLHNPRLMTTHAVTRNIPTPLYSHKMCVLRIHSNLKSPFSSTVKNKPKNLPIIKLSPINRERYHRACCSVRKRNSSQPLPSTHKPRSLQYPISSSQWAPSKAARVRPVQRVGAVRRVSKRENNCIPHHSPSGTS